jgi:hypothetical protein
MGDLLAILDISDPDHPRLERPRLPEGEAEMESKAAPTVHDEEVEVTPAITAVSEEAESTLAATAALHDD